MLRARSAWLLVFLAPVCAEYLVGYDDTIGNPAVLAFGLVVFAPLYGAPALAIRELARRTGGGWPTILLLAAAFGVVEAGLVDQSLFNPGYRDIPYWHALRDQTLIGSTGVSLTTTVSFVAGHVVGSIGAPIALVEALSAHPRQPWLRPRTLTIVGAAWLAGAGYVLADTLHGETFRPTTSQLGGAMLTGAALTTAALWPRAPARPAPGAVPKPITVGAVATLALGLRPLLDGLCGHWRAAGGWAPTLVSLVVLAVFATLVARWSRRSGWSDRHVLAVAAGALIAIGAVAFTVTPLGHVPAAAKLATNTGLLALVIALVARATARVHAAGRPPDPRRLA